MRASRTKEIYKAVSIKDWDSMNDVLSQENVTNLLHGISIHQDNVIHLAVHSGKDEPLRQILNRVKPEMLINFTSSVNAYGNTVLHEAAISGNLAAVKLLVEKNKELLEMKNDSGETPLFRASAFGQTKIVKYLASQQGQRVVSYDRKTQLKAIHRNKNDGSTILRAAVQGKQFGTALELLKMDETLVEHEEEKETSLYMLAKIPHVFKNRRKEMGFWKSLLHLCIPVGLGHDDSTKTIVETRDEDMERGLREGRPDGGIDYVEIEDGEMGLVITVMYNIYASFWDVVIDVFTSMKKMWKEKREHELALKLAPKLIKKDRYMQLMNKDSLPEEKKETAEEKEEKGNPLFTAVRTGNVELVKHILKEYPQALEQVNNKKQNILHLAAMYRQKEIFDLVKEKQIPMIRLARQIDVNGYTVLHSVADTQLSRGGRHSGPAYKLLDELEWFKNVEEIMPSYYTMLSDNSKQTAWELFEVKHKELHVEAQQWIKDTSQSCSAVAVLVATIVFAAAFTVPGGNNDKNGAPILINSPAFLFFTVADIVSLSCSLTAVVMFLAILTSPFELENFLATLPGRLTIGFGLLFVSVATTMLAFVSTIVLIIRLDQRLRWTTTLICCAAFFPVGVLALTNFPLLKAFIKSMKTLIKPCVYLKQITWVSVPRFFNFVKNSVCQPSKAEPKLEK